jgi:hypothetical protein
MINQASSRTLRVRQTILRIIAPWKLTPQREQMSDSAPTVSLQLGHLRNRMSKYLNLWAIYCNQKINPELWKIRTCLCILVCENRIESIRE